MVLAGRGTIMADDLSLLSGADLSIRRKIHAMNSAFRGGLVAAFRGSADKSPEEFVDLLRMADVRRAEQPEEE